MDSPERPQSRDQALWLATMKLTAAVLVMIALALALGFFGGYWEALCNGWPWSCQIQPIWPWY